MPKICYVEKKFSADHEAIITKANQLIAAFAKDNIDPTLRQVYYQFVSLNLIANSLNSYNRLGGIIAEARLAGRIDWDAITDQTRNVVRNSHWDNPGDIVNACARSYDMDTWVGQKYRPWCLIEKDALSSVFLAPCRELDVPLLSCRGYLSASEAWSTGRRMKEQIEDGQTPIVLHFGDHDPAGLDMSRDLRERLSMFAEDDIELTRVALNMDQIEEYRPPPNPGKTTDSKFKKYQELYGDMSWELDALSPTVLRDLLRGEIEKLVDEDLRQERLDLKEKHKGILRKLANTWEEAATAAENEEEAEDREDEEDD